MPMSIWADMADIRTMFLNESKITDICNTAIAASNVSACTGIYK
jgi:hypothetical protein